MQKRFYDYDLYVFDLDGTLYDQPKLRVVMAKRLLSYYLLHPFKLMELYYLYEFRKLKDKDDGTGFLEDNAASAESIEDDRLSKLDLTICRYMAKKHSKSDKLFSNIIYRWIYDNPLSAIKQTADTKLLDIIKKLKDNNKNVAIFSDYPVEDKLKALGITDVGMYCSADDKIAEYKPSPKGLNVIMNEYGITSDNVIMIGDRQEKDGLSAKGAGVDYMILPRKVLERAYDFE